MSVIFGFDEALTDIDNFIKKGDRTSEKNRKWADKMRDEARKIAESKGLRKSGKGTEGILTDHGESKSEVGWSTRPNFHLYFHEVGFHALDNRFGKQYIKRTGKRRQRGYRKVRATYISPKPHMRPAFDKLEKEYYSDMENLI